MIKTANNEWTCQMGSLHRPTILKLRQSLKKCQLGVTSVIKKWTGRKGIFIFLKEHFQIFCECGSYKYLISRKITWNKAILVTI